MEKLIDGLGMVMAIAGFILCGLAGLLRLSGTYYIAGYEALTLLQAGMALMIAACMIRLYFPNQQAD